MSVEPIGFLFLILGFLILKRGPLFGVYLFVPATLLGSCAALIVSGATIQPSHLLLGFLTIATFMRPGAWALVSQRLTFPKEGFWLVATACFGVVGAYIFPRFFAGATYVVAVGSTGSGNALIQVPLGPTTGNLTQSVYFISDAVCFLICYAIAKSREGFNALTQALILYCAMNIVFAVLDLATFWTGTSFLLDFMRNATYAMLGDNEINGLKRIVGSFTEASAFAYATIWACGFTFRLWLGGIRPKFTLGLTLVNMVLLVMCTSSTGYVALPVLLAFIYGTTLWRLVQGGELPRPVYTFLAFAPLLLILSVTIVLLTPSWSATVFGMINDLVINKSASQSGQERGTWNQTAINAFFATYGLGAGIGTVRSSSFPLAVIANLGAVGAFTYGLFIALTLLRRASGPLEWYPYEVRAAARTGCVGVLIAASISGALIDLGLPFFILAAIACAASDGQTDEEPDDAVFLAPVPIVPALAYDPRLPEVSHEI